ncbi:MAG: nuclear transport factor 2 family protein [Beijerinckiaceae bacterium]|nr:nuclear transport factor 2 family protein [Beijerinckiaceae bacterium]
MTLTILRHRLANAAFCCGLLGLIALTAVPMIATPARADTTATAQNEKIVRDAFQRWAAGENVFQRLLAEDIVWTIPGSGSVARTYRGMNDFVENASMPLVSRLATPLVPHVEHIWAVEDRVMVRFNASATTTGGHPYRNQFVWFFRMKDGKVAEAEAFLDLAAYEEVVANNAPRTR